MPKKSNESKDELSHFTKRKRKSKYENKKDEEQNSDDQSSSSSEEDNSQQEVEETVPDNVVEDLKEAIEQSSDKR